MKEYLIKNKSHLVKALAVCMIALLALMFFYWQKSIHEYFISGKDKLIIVGCSVLASVIMLIPKKLPKEPAKILEIMQLFLVPIFLFNRLESLVNELDRCVEKAPFYNILFIFLFMAFVYGISANVGIATAIGGGAVVLYYVAGFYTVQFRGSPILFSDILSAKTAFAVAGNYTFVLNSSIVLIFYEVLFISAVGFFLHRKSEHKKLQFIASGVIVAVCVVVMVYLVRSDYLVKKGFTITPFLPIGCAQQNGLLLNSVISLNESQLIPPKGYSKDSVEKIIAKYSSESNEQSQVEVAPNIVVIMNESFTDIDYLETINTSEVPIPKFKAINENCIKGTLISSVLGGNTPNSEFECLTGCSLAFLPTGIVAYQQLINRNISTLASMVKSDGYSTTAIHLYDPSYFDRKRIYPLLGIDKFISEENYPRDYLQIEYIKNIFAADWCSFAMIEKEYMEKTSDDKLFSFCVTIQNHGGYFGGLNDIQVLGVEKDVNYANEYVSLLRRSDDAFANLLQFFSEYDEPTIVVMYGDHQPYLFDDNYVPIWDGYDYTAEQKRFMQSKVPFVIWANYDIEEENVGEISINYLGPLIMKAAGLPLSDFYKFLDKLRENVPVISAVCFVDKDGNHFYDYHDSVYADAIEEYEYLQYNYLKGKSKRSFYGE